MRRSFGGRWSIFSPQRSLAGVAVEGVRTHSLVDHALDVAAWSACAPYGHGGPIARHCRPGWSSVHFSPW